MERLSVNRSKEEKERWENQKTTTLTYHFFPIISNQIGFYDSNLPVTKTLSDKNL
ncbi:MULTISPECIES: hypothetical protein [Leptospira]|uniref:hypothetical protein n=1 Tax=Leptospira TaxID=171 RepID=UPI0003460D90|nr:MULTISPECIES: hypothetical protein [Leptospira]